MPHAKGRSAEGLLEVLRSAYGPETDRMGHWEAVHPHTLHVKANYETDSCEA